MDHVALPSDPAYIPVCVPCLSDISCAVVEFDAYPQTRGWDLSRLLAGDFSQKPGPETAAFLQDWLYFVLLRTVVGEIAERDLYIEPHSHHPHGRVTTKLLETHVHRRLTELKTLYRNDQSNTVWSVLEKVESCLARLSHFCLLPDSSSWPLPPEVDLSLRALGLYLSSAFYGGLHAFQLLHSFLPFLRFGAAPVLRSRMLTLGWCPSDVSMVLEQFSPSSAYYASLLKRPPAPGDHATCTGQKCLAFQLNEETYETRHATQGCCCSLVGPALSELIDIVRSGGTALLTIVADAETEAARLEVTPYKPGQRYVCFSHVWSHGLGNPHENKLPMCQIFLLKSLLVELFDLESSLTHLNKGHFTDIYRRYRGVTIPFWIDSLCIPVRGEYSAIRSLAVSRIQDVFRNAHQVLVLDAELQSTDLNDVCEGLMRLSLSQWMRRLWTLLEGTLGSRVHVKFKDCIINLDNSYEQLTSYKGREGEGHDLRALFGSLAADASMFYWKMRSLRLTVVDGFERKMVGYSRKIFLGDPKDEVIRKQCVGFMEAFVASRYRTTSRTEDVYLCLANLLGLDASGLSSVPIESRMRVLFQTQTVFPQGILFVQGPRMREHGWRWAVTGFDDARTSQVEAPIRDFTPARRDEMGLTLVYPALILPPNFTRNNHEDILVSTAAEKAGRVIWWQLKFLDDAEFGTAQQNDNTDAEGTIQGSVSSKTSLCVIFYRPTLSYTPGISMAAALVSIDQEGNPKHALLERKDGIPCSFIQLALVQIIRSGEELTALSRREDLRLQHLEKQARFVKDRSWTVQ